MSAPSTDEPDAGNGSPTSEPPAFLQPEWRRRLRDRLAADEEFQHIARWTTVTIEVSAPEGSAVLAIDAGRLVDEPALGTPIIHLDAPTVRWAKFLDRVPPAWHNDMLGFSRRHADVELDTGGETLVRHLRVLNRMWEVARADR